MPLQRHSDVPAFLSAGPLVLATGSRTLTGPAGTVELDLGPYSVLRELMRRPGDVVPVAWLVDALYPDPDLECEVPERAVVTRVYRAREAMERVGVPGDMLRCRRGDGYVLDAGSPRVVRSYTPEQVALLDRIVATHPDRALVADLAPLFSHVHARVAEAAHG